MQNLVFDRIAGIDLKLDRELMFPQDYDPAFIKNIFWEQLREKSIIGLKDF